MAEASVRILPLGGAWRTLGTDPLRGIVPEGIEPSSDDWGPSALNFSLKAELGARRPDLLPYTPVELEVGGVIVWAGFIFQRPSDANGYQVGCRGWQSHLDDDLVDRAYVQTRLTDYRDQRSFLGSNLTVFKTNGMIDGQGEGAIILLFREGSNLAIGDSVGVTLDLGPDSVGRRVVMDWESSNNWGSASCFVKGTDGEDASVGSDNAFSFLLNSGASGTSAGSFSANHRYVHVLLNQSVATAAGAFWLRIKAIRVFRSTAYESGNASILKADQVIKDVLPLAPLLSQDASKIAAGTFSLPAYATGGYVTPKTAMEAVNMVEFYRLKIGGERLRQLVFDPKPDAPIAEVGEWSGSQFDDATVTGEPIYNRAILDGIGPDGARLVSKRTQAGDQVSRRGFTRSSRIDVSTPGTQAIYDRICDLWLAEHKTAPFSGKLTITGEGARRPQVSTPIPPHEFLLFAGEKVRFTNRVDPDSGKWGRDGRIAGVTYHHETRSVELSIDNQPHRWDEVLARYAALVEG